MQKTLNSEHNSVFLHMLLEARAAVGMTQVQLAAALGMQQSDVSKIERGVRRLDAVELYQLIKALGLSFVDFAVELDNRLEALSARHQVNRRHSPET